MPENFGERCGANQTKHRSVFAVSLIAAFYEPSRNQEASRFQVVEAALFDAHVIRATGLLMAIALTK